MPDGTDGPSTSELGLTSKDLGINLEPESTPNPELTAQLTEIDASIIDRHVQSKFRGDVILHGRTLKENSKPTLFEMLPNDVKYRDLDPTGQFSALSEIVRQGLFNPSNHTELEKQLAAGHVFAVLNDKNNPDIGILQFIYPVLGEDTEGRPFLTLDIFLRMPAKKLQELVKILVRNPDAVEQFYQMATNGLDGSVKRKKSLQVIGIDLKNFMPEDRFQYPETIPQIASTAAGQKRLNLDRFNILYYTRPQGQFSPEEIRESVNKIPEEHKIEGEQAQETKETQIPAPVSTPTSEAKKVTSSENIQRPSRPSGLQGGPLEGLPNLVRKIFGPKGK